jgi:hypothetical protein
VRQFLRQHHGGRVGERAEKVEIGDAKTGLEVDRGNLGGETAVKERERETDRERERERERERDRQRERERERQTERERDRERETDRERENELENKIIAQETILEMNCSELYMYTKHKNKTKVPQSTNMQQTQQQQHAQLSPPNHTVARQLTS